MHTAAEHPPAAHGGSSSCVVSAHRGGARCGSARGMNTTITATDAAPIICARQRHPDTREANRHDLGATMAERNPRSSTSMMRQEADGSGSVVHGPYHGKRTEATMYPLSISSLEP